MGTRVKIRETVYLWYLEGKVLTPSGRVLGRYDSLEIAAQNFPTATFRVSADSLDRLN